MAVTPTPLIPPKDAETVQTTQYTATNCNTVIDKFTATNETSGNIVLSVNLVPSGGTATNANRIISQRSIAPKETYICPELIGHLLAPSWFISTIASATGLTVAATGRELT